MHRRDPVLELLHGLFLHKILLYFFAKKTYFSILVLNLMCTYLHTFSPHA
jgi:hypothetical protein